MPLFTLWMVDQVRALDNACHAPSTIYTYLIFTINKNAGGSRNEGNEKLAWKKAPINPTRWRQSFYIEPKGTDTSLMLIEDFLATKKARHENALWDDSHIT